MASPSRRSVVKGLLSIPVIGVIADQLSLEPQVFAHEVPKTKLEARRFEALTAVRLLNTMQRNHKVDLGRFAPLPELIKSRQVSVRLDNPSVERRGLGRTAYSKLNLASSEILPGWRLRFVFNTDRTRYAITIEDMTRDRLLSFGTDDRGTIWEGQIRSGLAKDAWYPSESLIVGAIIGAKPPKTPETRIQRVVRLLSSSIVAPVSADHCPEGGDCCCYLRCCHGSSQCFQDVACYCQPSPPGGMYCENCGCGCCNWICCPPA